MEMIKLRESCDLSLSSLKSQLKQAVNSTADLAFLTAQKDFRI